MSRRAAPLPAPDDSVVLVPGPWEHRTVRANGIALHVAEMGVGPLVLLLHGFPTFWWTWRAQLVALADAGFRAVAVDLRGYGASDKPPRGYDTTTLATDILKLISTLGEKTAMVVGTDVGGELAWTMAAHQPAAVRGLVVLGAAHPLDLRAAMLRDPRGQGRASAHVLGLFQLPRVPETRLTRDGEFVRELMANWTGPAHRRSVDFAESTARYADAMRVHPVAHCALEHFRWIARSMPRPDGRRYTESMRVPIQAPVLAVHGEDDSCILATSAQTGLKHVRGQFEWRPLPGVGHFPQEEAPDLVSAELVRWAKLTS